MLNAVPDDRSTQFGFLSDEIVREIVRRVLAGALRRDAPLASGWQVIEGANPLP
ncbi:hypothetical protein [Streptomyces sp. Midd1]|uniref:hypothetical protein n=1 Tax=Streptomyces sp. Midd3 TaxID=3161191 RepID=UPI0034DB13E5